MSQLELPLGLGCKCGEPATIDRWWREPGNEMADGQCRGCGLVYRFRKAEGWWVMTESRMPRPQPPLDMPEKYKRMWGSWLVGYRGK